MPGKVTKRLKDEQTMLMDFLKQFGEAVFDAPRNRHPRFDMNLWNRFEQKYYRTKPALLKTEVNKIDDAGRNLFFYAIQYNHHSKSYFSKIKKWLVRDGCNIHVKDKFGNNVLMYEAVFGHNTNPEDYEYYNNFTREEIDIQTDIGTPLNMALKKRNFKFALYLIEKGANVDLIDAQAKQIFGELAQVLEENGRAVNGAEPQDESNALKLRLRV